MLDYANRDKEMFNEFFLGCNSDTIKSNVIIAPCWHPASVGIKKYNILSSGFCRIWNCFLDGKEFTYISTGVGAHNCADTIMALGDTPCKKLLFLGSAGALDKRINIGDFIIPQGIICAEGSSRYLQSDLSVDIFGKKFCTDSYLRKLIVDSLNIGDNIIVHENNQVGITVESIYSQFPHLNEFLAFGCSCIDMEASAFLAAASKIDIPAAVCFCVSDNVFNNESLIEISDKKIKFRKALRKKYVINVIAAILQS